MQVTRGHIVIGSAVALAAVAVGATFIVGSSEPRPAAATGTGTMAGNQAELPSACGFQEVDFALGEVTGGTLEVLAAIPDTDAYESSVYPAASHVCVPRSVLEATRRKLPQAESLEILLGYDPHGRPERYKSRLNFESYDVDEAMPAPPQGMLISGVTWNLSDTVVRVTWSKLEHQQGSSGGSSDNETDSDHTGTAQLPANLPKFSDYPAPAAQRVDALKLSPEDDAWTMRTRLRDAWNRGPDFAGSATIAIWGCGTTCATGVVLDAQGMIHQLPDGDDEGPSPTLDYRRDSSLLIAKTERSLGEETECVFEAYVWTGRTFDRVAGFPQSSRGTCS